jgi:hypothetical protein
MQEPGSPAVREEEHPVVSARCRRPFLLPRLGVAEEVDFPQAARESLLRGEVRQELERRTRVELAVVSGLEQEQAVVIDRAVRHGDAASTDSQEHETQPSACSRTIREQRVELPHRRVRANRRPFLILPARRLEPPCVVTRRRDVRPVYQYFERRLADLFQPRQPVPDVRPELRGEARPVGVPRARQLQVRRVAAFPGANRQTLRGRKLRHRGDCRRRPEQLRQLQDIPLVDVAEKHVPDCAIRFVRLVGDHEVGPRRVIVGEQRKASDGQAVSDGRLTHQWRDGDDPSFDAHDDDVQLAVRLPRASGASRGAEAIPPRANPFMPEERVRNLRACHHVIPLGFEPQEGGIVGDHFRGCKSRIPNPEFRQSS